MTRITRWEPFREARNMHDMLDRFMSDAMVEWPRSIRGGDGFIPLDVVQTEDEVVVKATTPGFKPEDINISVTNDVLTIQGDLEEEVEKEEAQYYLRERRTGHFSRTISLPTPVKAESAKAEFENGILTLTLPKVEEVKPKTIAVKAK